MRMLSVIPAKTWLLLLAGPALFLVGIIVASIFLSFRGVEAAQISARVPLLMPQILLGVLLSLGVLIFLAVQLGSIWDLPNTPKAFHDVLVGIAAGCILALLYLY